MLAYGRRAIIAACTAALFSLPMYAQEAGHTLALTVGRNINGRLNGKGEVNSFKFNVTTSGTFSAQTSGALNTSGELYFKSGELTVPIERDEDSGVGDNFAITTTVTPGTYYLFVSGATGSETGSYTLVSSFQSSVKLTAKFALTGLNGFPIVSGGAPLKWNGTDFGTQEANSPAKILKVTVKNTGKSVLDIFGVSITGSVNRSYLQFSIASEPAKSVAPGASTTFTVAYEPNYAEQHEAVLNIESNAIANPFFTMNLRGNATEPVAR